MGSTGRPVVDDRVEYPNETTFCIADPHNYEHSDDFRLLLYLHSYTLGALHFLLAVSITLMFVRLLFVLGIRRPFICAIHFLLIAFAVFRTMFIVSQGHVSGLIFQIIGDLGIPALTSAYALTMWVMYEIGQFKMRNAKLQSKKILMTVIIFHFIFIVAVDIVVGKASGTCWLLLICQIFNIIWGMILTIIFFIVTKRIYMASKELEPAFRPRALSIPMLDMMTTVTSVVVGAPSASFTPELRDDRVSWAEKQHQLYPCLVENVGTTYTGGDTGDSCNEIQNPIAHGVAVGSTKSHGLNFNTFKPNTPKDYNQFEDFEQINGGFTDGVDMDTQLCEVDSIVAGADGSDSDERMDSNFVQTCNIPEPTEDRVNDGEDIHEEVGGIDGIVSSGDGIIPGVSPFSDDEHSDLKRKGTFEVGNKVFQLVRDQPIGLNDNDRSYEHDGISSLVDRESVNLRENDISDHMIDSTDVSAPDGSTYVQTVVENTRSSSDGPLAAPRHRSPISPDEKDNSPDNYKPEPRSKGVLSPSSKVNNTAPTGGQLSGLPKQTNKSKDQSNEKPQVTPWRTSPKPISPSELSTAEPQVAPRQNDAHLTNVVIATVPKRVTPISPTLNSTTSGTLPVQLSQKPPIKPRPKQRVISEPKITSRSKPPVPLKRSPKVLTRAMKPTPNISHDFLQDANGQAVDNNGLAPNSNNNNDNTTLEEIFTSGSVKTSKKRSNRKTPTPRNRLHSTRKINPTRKIQTVGFSAVFLGVMNFLLSVIGTAYIYNPALVRSDIGPTPERWLLFITIQRLLELLFALLLTYLAWQSGANRAKT